MEALWIAIAAIGITLLNLYWDILKPMLAAIWSVKEDGIAWKLRSSLIAAGISVWNMLVTAYKKGLLDAIITIIVKLIRSKLGVPTAMRKAGIIK